MQQSKNYPQYSLSILRYGLSLMMLWFSAEQLLHTSDWVAYIPDSIVSFTHLQATTIVTLNAIFELVFGLFLLIGIYIRVAATLLALHLFHIMYMLGYGEIAVRDFALGLAFISLAVGGPDPLALEFTKSSSFSVTMNT